MSHTMDSLSCRLYISREKWAFLQLCTLNNMRTSMKEKNVYASIWKSKSQQKALLHLPTQSGANLYASWITFHHYLAVVTRMRFSPRFWLKVFYFLPSGGEIDPHPTPTPSALPERVVGELIRKNNYMRSVHLFSIA